MAYTIKIKNDSGSIQTWAGKEFAIAEEYTVPTDGNRIKYQNNSDLLTAIGAAEALVGDGSEYFTDVNTGIDWLKGVSTQPVDIDGAPLTRTKITKTGWHYQCQTIEGTTAKLSSGHNADTSDTDLGFLTIKYYNVSGTELVAGTQAELDTDCVETRLFWEPTYDVELIGGTLYQSEVPTSDVRMWVTAIPDLTVAQGGSVPFCIGGLNLKHMGTGAVYDIDGKTPKLLPYDATYHTNKFEIRLTHPAGGQCPIMLVFKLFRENT